MIATVVFVTRLVQARVDGILVTAGQSDGTAGGSVPTTKVLKEDSSAVDSSIRSGSLC